MQDAVDADMKKFEMDIAALEADMETRSEAGLSFNKLEDWHLMLMGPCHEIFTPQFFR